MSGASKFGVNKSICGCVYLTQQGWNSKTYLKFYQIPKKIAKLNHLA